MLDVVSISEATPVRDFVLGKGQRGLLVAKQPRDRVELGWRMPGFDHQVAFESCVAGEAIS
jgi:hypothetical protein